MKTLLWFLAWSALAVGLALLVGDNRASVSLFWFPHRLDLSFNLALFGLLGLFVLLHLSWRGLALLRELPERAQRWRALQQERAVYGGLVDALTQLLAGRFVRARSAARNAIAQLQTPAARALPRHRQLSGLAHLLAAESAHALSNHPEREQHLAEVLSDSGGAPLAELREGALLRATRWALEQRDSQAAAHWWAQLPQGATRRIQALRLKLKLARLNRASQEALDTVRLLAKHRAYTPLAARTLIRALLSDALRQAHDTVQWASVWRDLTDAERQDPDLCIAALERWAELYQQEMERSGSGADNPDAPAPVHPTNGSALSTEVRQALNVPWEGYAALPQALKVRLVAALVPCLSAWPAHDGLVRIEQAQQADPGDVYLQYLAGMACVQRGLWGKAQTLLERTCRGPALPPALRRQAWCALAELAERRGDLEAAAAAWKTAARL